MKRLLAIALLPTVLLLVNCGGGGSDEVEKLRTKIADTKADIAEQEATLADLRQQLYELDPEAAQKTRVVPVKVMKLEPRYFEHTFEVNGTVEAKEDVIVVPEMTGTIRKILVEKGQSVQKGQLLATLNTSVIDNQISELKVNLALAETTYEKQKKLWDQKIGSEMQYLQAKTNRNALKERLQSLIAQRELAVIKAPITGIVDDVFQKQGEFGSPQVPFAQMIDMSRLQVMADVSEAYANKIQKGQTVELRFPALDDLTLRAPISRIGNVVNVSNRTFTAQIDISNPGNKIKPNMVGIVKIRDAYDSSALVVPANIIKQQVRGDQTYRYLYVAQVNDQDTIAAKTIVEIGQTNNNETKITSGLESGDEVITSGHSEVGENDPILIKQETAAN